jgi:hypothetical protein
VESGELFVPKSHQRFSVDKIPICVRLTRQAALENMAFSRVQTDKNWLFLSRSARIARQK